jgi:hypothetical protein
LYDVKYVAMHKQLTSRVLMRCFADCLLTLCTQRLESTSIAYISRKWIQFWPPRCPFSLRLCAMHKSRMRPVRLLRNLSNYISFKYTNNNIEWFPSNMNLRSNVHLDQYLRLKN